MLKLFGRADPARRTAELLHRAIAARAREPVFHARFAIPDTIDGRFDLFTMHAFLVLDALKTAGPSAQAASEHLIDLIFAGFDDALRELGVGDIGLGRRLTAMASAFYGRLAAYEAGRAEPELSEALVRNLYRGDGAHRDDARLLAHYMFAAREDLRAQDGLSEGRVDFGPMPGD